MKKFDKKQSQGLRNNFGVKKDDTLSTLELWQAHLRALRRASSENTQTVEILDTAEQTSSTVIVNMTNNPPTP